MPYEYVLVEREDPIAVVTINRPAKLNALNWTVIGEVASAIEELDRDPAIRCVVLTGAGDRAFAAGADIAEMSDKSPMDMLAGSFDNWDRIRRVHIPIIAAVGGFALGGGHELAMHADMIVASEDAKFGQPEILLGIMPGAGGTQRLARTVGKYRTMELCLTGDQFTAQQMFELGLVNRVVPKGQHLEEAKQLARTVAARAPLAVRLIKDAVLTAYEVPLEDGLAYEKRLFALLFSTEDAKEGMGAFVEKRQANFKGR
ncbi:MAG TPA: enoyl-CoA hydratase-related protein [Ktedonobacterales bacterium]